MEKLKDGWIYNFAYGSNMLSSRMHDNGDKPRCPSAKPIGVAKLSNYRFIISNRNDGKRTASVVPAYGKYVLGVLWQVPETEITENLDKREGVPITYSKEYLTVEYNGEEYENVLTYVCCENIIDKDRKPKPDYMGYIIDGAKEKGIDKDDPSYYKELLSWK